MEADKPDSMTDCQRDNRCAKLGERWAVVEKFIDKNGPVMFSVIFSCLLMSDVTREYTRPDGSQRRQFCFTFALCMHTAVICYPSMYLRRLINNLLDDPCASVLFLATMIFNVVVSAISITLFRYFYVHVFDIYGDPDPDSDYSINWYRFVNCNFLLFTYVLSRAVPPTTLAVMFVNSMLRNLIQKLIKSADAFRTVNDNGSISHVQFPAFLVKHSTWFLSAWLLFFFVYVTREEPWMQAIVSKMKSVSARVLSALIYVVRTACSFVFGKILGIAGPLVCSLCFPNYQKQFKSIKAYLTKFSGTSSLERDKKTKKPKKTKKTSTAAHHSRMRQRPERRQSYRGKTGEKMRVVFYRVRRSNRTANKAQVEVRTSRGSKYRNIFVRYT